MNDDDLIGYCDLHCKTERALFHWTHINRMIALAGYPKDFVRELDGSVQWVSLHEPMQFLVDRARTKKKLKLIKSA